MLVVLNHQLIADEVGHTPRGLVGHAKFALKLLGGNRAASAAIGIICGCYAKFHRQVVHIEERMKQRGK